MLVTFDMSRELAEKFADPDGPPIAALIQLARRIASEVLVLDDKDDVGSQVLGLGYEANEAYISLALRGQRLYFDQHLKRSRVESIDIRNEAHLRELMWLAYARRQKLTTTNLERQNQEQP